MTRREEESESGDAAETRAESDPLQPPSVPPGWLEDREGDINAKRLQEYEERLMADGDLVARLQWANFAGKEWDRLAEVLSQYGRAVMLPWLFTGIIFQRCREKGLHGVGYPVEMSQEDREDLATMTVAVAIDTFRRRVLIPHIWDPRKGATLKTYFIGQILIRFVDEYRSFMATRTRATKLRDADELQEDAIASSERTDTVALVRIEADRLFHKIADPIDRYIVFLRTKQYTMQEIAEVLGLSSERAVEGRLYRLGKRMAAEA